MIAMNTAADARELLTRFGGFFDAVLVEVHLVLSRASADRYALLTLLAQASTAADGGGEWHAVVLRIDGLNAYRLSEGPGTYLVLSDGLDIGGVGEGSCLLNLSPGQAAATDAKTDLAQFVAGVRCSYEVDATFTP